LLTSSWIVYGVCQEDMVLPVIAFVTIFISTLRKPSRNVSPLRFFNAPWTTVAIFTFICGYIWRIFFPEPMAASSFLPLIHGPLQSAIIFATMYLWIRPSFHEKSYYLTFFAWSTTALSINVPFSPMTLAAFILFCIIASVRILLTAWRSTKPDGKPIKQISHYIYSLLLMIISVGFFFLTIGGIYLGDQTFMHLISNYSLPINSSHFINMNSALRLDGPGLSGRDIRPVMEIDRNGQDTLYLVTQVFEKYNQGIWKVPENVKRTPISNDMDIVSTKNTILMFSRLGDVIPTPKEVVAVRGKGGPYEKDINGIIYSHKEKKTQKIMVAVKKPAFSPGLDNEDDLTLIPLEIKEALRRNSDKIISSNANPYTIARSIESFFHKNFLYTLDVGFTANNQGIIKMIEEKRAAYCSYFASAMTLMLREQGIPARIVTGFLASERIGRKEDQFLIRVRDAHAWVEVLLPTEANGKNKQWVRFDPTPGAARLEVLNQGQRLNRLADWLWLTSMEIRSEIQDLRPNEIPKSFWTILTICFALFYFRKHLFKKGDNQGKGISRHVQSSVQENEELLKIYHLYETCLKKRFKISREDFETDNEFINRMSQHKGVSLTTTSRIKDFIAHYRAARFGSKDSPHLQKLIISIENHADKEASTIF